MAPTLHGQVPRGHSSPVGNTYGDRPANPDALAALNDPAHVVSFTNSPCAAPVAVIRDEHMDWRSAGPTTHLSRQQFVTYER